jgi:hypothetical protein
MICDAASSRFDNPLLVIASLNGVRESTAL